MSDELKALELKHSLENLLFAMRMNRFQNDIEIYNMIIRKKCPIKEWDEAAIKEKEKKAKSKELMFQCKMILEGYIYLGE